MKDNIFTLPGFNSVGLKLDANVTKPSEPADVLEFRGSVRNVSQPANRFKIIMGAPLSQKDTLELCERIRLLFLRGDSIEEIGNFIGPIMAAIFEGYQTEFNVDLCELIKRITKGKRLEGSDAFRPGA
jgi:hypothetical protein